MAKNVFMRTEKKYMVNTSQRSELLLRSRGLLIPDAYGSYTLCNIYFDTDSFDLIRASLEKPVFKEKLRMRSYGVPKADTNVFFEIKRKFDGVVGKRRIDIPLCELRDYLEHGKAPAQDSQIFREIDYFMNFYHPKPKVFLAYDRTAFCSPRHPGFRVTFDNGIRSRTDDLYLEHGDCGEYLLDDVRYRD